MRNQRIIARALMIGMVVAVVAVAIPTLSAPPPTPLPKPFPIGDCSGEGDRYACCDYQKAMCMDMCVQQSSGPSCFENCERSFVQCLYGG